MLKHEIEEVWGELYELAWDGQEYVDDDNDCSGEFSKELEDIDNRFGILLEQIPDENAPAEQKASWTDFVEDCYKEYKTGNMSKEAWANIAMKAVEKFIVDKHCSK